MPKLAPALLLCLAPLAAGQEVQSIPSGGESLLPDGFDIADATLQTWGNPAARASVIEIDGLPFDRAIRVENPSATDPRYGVQIGIETRGDIAEGDTLLVSLFARGATPTPGEPIAVHARLQQNGGEPNGGGYAELVPLDVSTAGDLSDPAAWVQYIQPVKAPLTQSDGTHSFSVHLGEKAQTVELGDLQILNYGPDRDRESLPVTRTTYPGREPDAPWRAAAAARIDKYHKGDLTVQVVGAAGQPVAGALVNVAMTRHAFGFGTAADADLLVMSREQFEKYAGGGHGSYKDLTWDDVLKYRATVEANFNKVVLENDLKPGGWVAGRKNDGARFRRDWTLAALDWLKERNIEVRGHYGVWGPIETDTTWNTGGLDTEPEYGAELLRYLKTFVPQIAGKVGEWDAINHIVGWGPETLGKRYGGDYYADVIRLMRELDPQAEIWVNEGNIVSGGGQDPAYRAVIDDLIDRGAAPDGAGFMAHFRDGSLMGMERMYEVFDAYAGRGLKLQLTELDYDGLNRELQADYFRDVLTLAFSHPAMDGVVQWGFWAKRHWRPESALWQENWSLRPAGVAYRDLVLRDWWTRAAVRTGADGTVTVRGFRGDYEVTVDGATTATATLGGNGAEVRVTVE